MSAKAALAVAKTVNVPSPCKVATKPVVVTAAASVLQSVEAIANVFCHLLFHYNTIFIKKINFS